MTTLTHATESVQWDLLTPPEADYLFNFLAVPDRAVISEDPHWHECEDPGGAHRYRLALFVGDELLSSTGCDLLEDARTLARLEAPHLLAAEQLDTPGELRLTLAEAIHTQASLIRMNGRDAVLTTWIAAKVDELGELAARFRAESIAQLEERIRLAEEDRDAQIAAAGYDAACS